MTEPKGEQPEDDDAPTLSIIAGAKQLRELYGRKGEMIERVAWAIWHSGTSSLAECRIQARAAIEAMREPTREMRQEGYDADDEVGSPSNVWRAMIDAALKDQPHG